MPTYTYKCPRCETIREVVKRIAKADTPEWCEPCKRMMIKTPPKNTTFALKGKGWFKSGGY